MSDILFSPTYLPTVNIRQDLGDAPVAQPVDHRPSRGVHGAPNRGHRRPQEEHRQAEQQPPLDGHQAVVGGEEDVEQGDVGGEEGDGVLQQGHQEDGEAPKGEQDLADGEPLLDEDHPLERGPTARAGPRLEGEHLGAQFGEGPEVGAVAEAVAAVASSRVDHLERLFGASDVSVAEPPVLERMETTELLEFLFERGLVGVLEATVNLSVVGVEKAGDYDIVINGGGIVGFSFLAAIKSLPHLSQKRVLLIEQQNEPKFKSSTEAEEDPLSENRTFSNRVSSLTAASKRLFEELDVWHSSLEPFAKRVEGMHVWTDHYQNAVHFEDSSGGGGQEATCYIVENNRMIRSLVERIRADQAEVAYSTSVQEIEQVKKEVDDDSSFRSEATSILLRLSPTSSFEKSSSSVLQTKLLIGCDGFKSLVRSRSTLPYYAAELAQMGIVGTLQLESPFADNSVAFQRFLADQLVIALLPLSPRHASFVLSVQSKDLDGWMSLADEDFVHRLNSEISREVRTGPVDRFAAELSKAFTGFLVNKQQSPFQSRVPPFITEVVSGSRAAFPLGFGTTVPRLAGTIQTNNFYVRELLRKRDFANTVIMGDAAHRVHPLAGQGLNLGLGDAHELALALEGALSQGAELFGDTVDSAEALTSALAAFERARVAKLVPMMGAIHSMQTLMAWTPAALLSALNALPWLKSQVVSYANSR
ncbi:putative ubiquinone biosynthesis monooxygenase [Tyrophagus putrescentiae]|nr:putative ubiquinone biosynthesis monooxygenase [Tyrophagus putrescentiae]